MNSTPQLKSYVWHGDQCFFVSTIERDSSACVEPPALRFLETMIWEFDWDASEKGELLYQNGSQSLQQHLHLCETLHRTGELPEED